MGFKVTVYLKVEYLKTMRLWEKLLWDTSRKPYLPHRMVP